MLVPAALGTHRPLVMIARRCGDGEKSTPAGGDVHKFTSNAVLSCDYSGLENTNVVIRFPLLNHGVTPAKAGAQAGRAASHRLQREPGGLRSASGDYGNPRHLASVV